MHEAIVTKIKVQPHPDPEVHSLAVGYVCEETVIVSKDTKDGELGLYFPCELQLSEAFTKANDLIRRKDEHGNTAGGMFDENRRVRVQKFRGVKSNGFWCQLSYLSTFGDTSALKEGDKLAEFKKVPICQKYFSKKHNEHKNKQKQPEKKKTVCVFPEHKDTEQFKSNVNKFKEGDKIVITLKMEGTSQRVARNLEFREPRWWEKIVSKFTKLDLSRMVNLNGTRHVTLNYKDPSSIGYYSDSFRQKVADKIVPYLDEYMELFCEVVGWSGPNTTIMPKHGLTKIKDKEITKLYKDPVIFSYECQPGEFAIYIYRIAYVLPNGKTVDLPWDDVKEWCVKHKINHVPELTSFTFDGNHRDLSDLVESLSDGPDPINPSHPREGVCIRVDGSEWKCWKNKGWAYKVLNDLIKSNDDYIDGEEVS